MSIGPRIVGTPWVMAGARKLVTSNESETVESHSSDITQQRENRLLTAVPLWCLYEGVTCGTDPLNPSFNRVLDISLRNLRLSGTLPESIEHFNLLTGLDIGENAIHGTIPRSVTSMRALLALSLDHNLLSGTIPSGMHHLTLLTLLELNSNYLTMGSDSTVAVSTFASATREGHLDLSSNCLAYESTVTATHCRPHPTSRKLHPI